MDLTWLEITINTTGADLDTLAAKLTANGVVGLAIEDEADFKQFLEQNQQYWDYVDDDLLQRMKGAARVKFYVTDDQDGYAQLRQYTAGLEGYEILSTPLQENDWATSWQKYYKPMPVGEKLFVVPEWERQRAARGQGARVAQPRPDLRYGQPCLHPALSGGGGADRPPGRPGAGSGLRQRHFVHRCPVSGR